MLVLGLLLAVLALGFGVVVVVDNWGGADHLVTAFGYGIGHLTLVGIFLSGVVLALLFCIGLWLAGLSTRVHRRSAERRRGELRDSRAREESVVAERDRLADELRAERERHHDVDVARSERVGATTPVGEHAETAAPAGDRATTAGSTERHVYEHEHPHTHEATYAHDDSAYPRDPHEGPVEGRGAHERVDQGWASDVHEDTSRR